VLKDLEIELLSLNDFPDVPDIVEDGKTFFENALKKARAVSEKTGLASLADDSGLEVDSLGGRPGIHSARYSGPDATDASNIRKLLTELHGRPDELRRAAFRCVLVLYRPGGDYDVFDGKLDGIISTEVRGENGFGYDPVFLIPDLGRTAAEVSPDEKNRISHRAKALEKLKVKVLSAYLL
jgi:XTP/dITP diphosphohydrolase